MFDSRKMPPLLALALLFLSLQALCSLAEVSPTCSDPTCEAEKDAPALPELPEMVDGGVFVHFHLYKTGGSSVTELFVELKQEFDEIAYEEAEAAGKFDEEEDFPDDDNNPNSEFLEGVKIIFVNNREDMTEEDIEWSITEAKEKKKPVFYNFHVEFPATMYPTLIEAAPILREWRARAEAEGIPFFATTVLREPLGHALSFFNFFHVTVDEMEWSPFAGDMDATEENFLKTYVGNRLCHLMYNDAHGILEAPDEALREGLKENLFHFMDEHELNRRNEPSHCDADALRTILFEDNTFDYVGITERLSTHILPMFTKIVFGDARLAGDAEVKKKAADMTDDTWVPLKKNTLSESTKELVARESAKDQKLYEEARDRFAHWPSYL
ncbi:unnamed protein product [Pseudo-nitzschia multistriata]|uniref:Uncharacterized protein n=1 Tax=Pseudo-nitzschia multistriata TaxID=183589 RepID=A0A448Z0F6_9STRA|nr:unnamed protein product [Pseudo-nitzschia multistriata]